jgi:hypothetical protein
MKGGLLLVLVVALVFVVTTNIWLRRRAEAERDESQRGEDPGRP